MRAHICVLTRICGYSNGPRRAPVDWIQAPHDGTGSDYPEAVGERVGLGCWV